VFFSNPFNYKQKQHNAQYTAKEVENISLFNLDLQKTSEM